MYFNIILQYTAVRVRGWLGLCHQLEMNLCLLQVRVNGTCYPRSSIEPVTQPVNSAQACICIRFLRFKCPILCRHANVTRGAFLLIFLAAHIKNIWYFHWVNVLRESYCGVDDPLASILKDLGSNLCQNTFYSAAFFFISLWCFLLHFLIQHKNNSTILCQTKIVVNWSRINQVLNSSVKAIPVQASTCPKDSRKAETARFKDNPHMKTVSWSALCTGRLYATVNIPGIDSVRGRIDPRKDHSSDIIGNRTRILPACSAVSQKIASPLAPQNPTVD